MNILILCFVLCCLFMDILCILQDKYLMHLHWIIVTFIIMVTSCVAYGCTKRMKKVEICHFIDFHITSLIFYRNGFKQLRDKTGIQTRIVSFAVSTLPSPVLLYHLVISIADYTKMQYHQFFPQFLKHLQKTESKRKSPVKRKFLL